VVGNPWKTWLLVRLETDEGLNGFARTVEAAIYELGHLYAGQVQAKHPYQSGDRLPLSGQDRERREAGE
jgi:hypothetical protein